MDEQLPYRRVLLKLSGEALQGDRSYGIDPATLNVIADQLKNVLQAEIQVGIVVGGGNIFRGAEASAAGMDRATGDYAGMLATIINALALQDALNRRVQVMDSTALSICMENSLPIIVFDLRAPRSIERAACGDHTGTRVSDTETAFAAAES